MPPSGDTNNHSKYLDWKGLRPVIGADLLGFSRLSIQIPWLKRIETECSKHPDLNRVLLHYSKYLDWKGLRQRLNVQIQNSTCKTILQIYSKYLIEKLRLFLYLKSWRTSHHSLSAYIYSKYLDWKGLRLAPPEGGRLFMTDVSIQNTLIEKDWDFREVCFLTNTAYLAWIYSKYLDWKGLRHLFIPTDLKTRE